MPACQTQAVAQIRIEVPETSLIHIRLVEEHAWSTKTESHFPASRTEIAVFGCLVVQPIDLHIFGRERYRRGAIGRDVFGFAGWAYQRLLRDVDLNKAAFLAKERER